MSESDEQGATQRTPMELNPLSVLYHPHFEPDLGMLRRALLVNEKVQSIVPANANYTPSVAVFKHMETLPNTFVPTPPDPDDVNIASDYFVLSTLDRAFEQLSKDPNTKRLKAHFSQSEATWDEALSIEGATFLSAAKLTYAVYMKLEECGLIFAVQNDGTFMVDERAANLIVSYLAQRMSYRLSVRTIAGIEDSFLLSTACDVYDGFEVDRNALFASAVLHLHLPANIEVMDHSSYAELRARYEDLRESFPIYLQQLQQLYRITDLSAAADMRATLHQIEAKLKATSDKIRESKLGDRVRNWLPFGLGSALSVGAAMFPAHAAAFTLGAIGVQAVGLGAPAKPMVGHFDGVRSMMLSANDEVLKATRLPRYLGDDLLRYVKT